MAQSKTNLSIQNKQHSQPYKSEQVLKLIQKQMTF
jgi:hypothetical protein